MTRLRRKVPLLFLGLLLVVAFVFMLSNAFAALGIDWTGSYVGPPDYSVLDAHYTPTSVFNGVSALDSNRAWAVGYYSDTRLGSHAFLVSTVDGGSNWTETHLSSFAAPLRGVDAVDANNVWAVGDSGLILKWNGASWSQQGAGVTTSHLYAVSFSDTSNGWAVGAGGTVLRTVNGGTNWTPSTSNTSSALRGVSAPTSDAAWAVGDSGTGIRWNGTSWGSASAGSTTLRSVSFADTSHGIAVGDDKSFFRWNGTGWSSVGGVPTSGLYSNYDLDVQGVSMSDSTNAVAVGTYSEVWRSADGGATWEASQIAPETGTATLTGVSMSGALVWASQTRQTSSPDAIVYKGTLLVPAPSTITPSAGTGGSISPATPQSIAPGASATFTITPNAGYHVADVLVDGSSVGALTSYTFANVTSDHTIHATFAINTYAITPSAPGGGGSITPGTAQTVNHGGSATFSVAPDPGYHIVDVLVDSVSKGTTTSVTFSNVTAAHTISATFAINTYTITPSVGTAGGSISPSTAQTVNHGSSRTFDIGPSAGYHILDVRVDGVSQGAIGSYTFLNVTANHTIVADFEVNEPNTYTITPSAGVGGSITPGTSQSVTSGGSRTFNIAPNAGYHIVDVLVDGVSYGAIGSHTFNNVTGPHTIAASFGLNTYSITPSAGGGGSITPGTAQNVSHGGSASFSIAANAGYHIADVLVDGASQGAIASYTFSGVTTGHTISASFAADYVPPVDQATWITIGTSSATARIGQAPYISGKVSHTGLVGTNVMVMVKRPGKPYYSYSSWRTVYSWYGEPRWMYKYYFKPGMVKGTYYYYAIVPPRPGFLGSRTPNTIAITLR